MFTTALILVFLLITALLATGTGWNNVLSPERNELVFADRNRDYGAYKLRQEHHRTMLLAMGIGLTIVGTTILVPTLFRSAVIETPRVQVIEIDDHIFDVVDPTLPKPTTPEPQPPKPQPSAPMVGAGLIVAVDSMPAAPVDTAAHDPGPKPDPNPGGGGKPDPGAGGGPNGGGGGGTGPKDQWELESLPEYPGGEPALHRYLSREVHYPEIDVDARHEGRVTVGFIIRSDGSVTDVKVLKGVSPTIDAEAERVVRAMIKWKPGRFNKREVDVRYALPIVFKLAKN